MTQKGGLIRTEHRVTRFYAESLDLLLRFFDTSRFSAPHRSLAARFEFRTADPSIYRRCAIFSPRGRMNLLDSSVAP